MAAKTDVNNLVQALLIQLDNQPASPTGEQYSQAPLTVYQRPDQPTEAIPGKLPIDP
jgi:hypothetical protein